MKELKPCSFCGGEAEIEMDESWYWNYHGSVKNAKLEQIIMKLRMKQGKHGTEG